MVQKVPFTQLSGNTMTIGTGTSRVIMGADSGNLKIQDSQSNTSVIEAGLGVQGAGGHLPRVGTRSAQGVGPDLRSRGDDRGRALLILKAGVVAHGVPRPRAQRAGGLCDGLGAAPLQGRRQGSSCCARR